MKLSPFLLSLLCTALSAGADDGTIYIAAGETEALEAKEGQKVVVHGEAAKSGKSSSGTNFVNFEGADFHLVTFKSDLGQFPDGEPADVYDGKRIAVEGVVSIYQGKPQVKLVSADQVRVLADDEEFPPKQAEAPVEEEKAATEVAKAPGEKPAAAEPERKPPVDASKYFK